MSTGPWQEESSGQRAAVLSRTRGLGCLRKRKLKALTLSPAYVTYFWVNPFSLDSNLRPITISHC